MDIRFDKLSTEAQMYALQNNVDGGKKGVIEEANGELQTLLNGLGITDATELMADTVKVGATNTNRAGNTNTRPSNQELQNHYNSSSNEKKVNIMVNTINDVTGRFQTIDNTIEEATNELLGIQKIIEPLYNAGGSDKQTSLKNILNKLDSESIRLPGNIKDLVTLLMDKVAENKNKALNEYKEKVKDAIKSYDNAYVTPYNMLGARTIPDIGDAVDVLTSQIDLVPDSAAERAFGMSAEEFAEKAETMSHDELLEAVQSYVDAVDYEVAKMVDETIRPAIDTIRDKMSENYTTTMKSIVEATQKGDVEIPNPIIKNTTTIVTAVQEGTFKEGNIKTSDEETVYTFLNKINDDYQASTSGVPTVEVNGQTFEVGKKYLEETPTGKRLVSYDRLGNKWDLSHGGIKVND